MAIKNWAFALLIATVPLSAAACEDVGTASARSSSPGDGDRSKGKGIQYRPHQTPSCDKVTYRRGITGRVVGSEWVDGGPHDGIRCLEIKTKSRVVLTRVSRRVYDRCIERDLYPRCANER